MSPDASQLACFSPQALWIKLYSLGSSRNLLTVHENYRNYNPPQGVRSAIEKLLSAVPEEFQAGLVSVVLTNSDSVGKGKTRRGKGRKYRQRSCGGFYHPRHKGDRKSTRLNSSH